MRGRGSSLSGDLMTREMFMMEWNEDLKICVTCLSSESVESRTTLILFEEVEQVTDEVATWSWSSRGAGRCFSISVLSSLSLVLLHNIHLLISRAQASNVRECPRKITRDRRLKWYIKLSIISIKVKRHVVMLHYVTQCLDIKQV